MTLVLVITQGVVAAAAVITLIFLLLRGVFSIEKRVANLETKIEPFWDALRQNVVPLLQGLTPPGNPITAERWDSLLIKLQSNRLTVDEAWELNAAFLEQQAAAKDKNDTTTLIAIGLGLALLAVLINQK